MSEPLAVLVDRDASIAQYGSWNGLVNKHVDDLIRYRRIIRATRPGLVIETGTGTGHSALWFAAHGLHVITVDIRDQVSDQVRDQAGTHVTFLTGDAASPTTAETIAMRAAGRRTLVSLDTGRRGTSTAFEIALYSALVSPGCHLVIERGVVAWFDANPSTWNHDAVPFGPRREGTMLDAISAQMPWRTDFERDTHVETLTPVTMNPAGWWRRRAAPPSTQDNQ